VLDAVVATWDDGGAIESFTVRSAGRPDAAALTMAVTEALGIPPTSRPLPDADVAFDHLASPWHTVVEVRSPDRPALLHDVAAALDAAGIDIQAAALSAEDQLVIDRFEVVDRNGAKLEPRHEEAVRRHLWQGVGPRRRFALLGRRQGDRRAASQASDSG
jgi:UTP:GlnB (protein PII) uridylyltransferase